MPRASMLTGSRGAGPREACSEPLRNVLANMLRQRFIDEGLVSDASAPRLLAELVEHVWVHANRAQAVLITFASWIAGCIMGVVRCRPFHDFTTETIVRTAIVTLAVICGVDISSPGREAVTAFIEFQTGGSSGRHTHPGEEIGYVLDGSLSLEQEGQPAVSYKAGQAFAVPPNVVHNATSSGSTGARVLSTYIIEKGKPVATPVK